MNAISRALALHPGGAPDPTDRRPAREWRAQAAEGAPTPFDELRAHTRGGRSGEFICATPDVEFHVYLQRGRVAWATDSAHPYEFSRDLMARGNIEAHVYREVLDSCRRDRLPLGETLVAWKLASLDDVRASLGHQLRLALGGLAECRSGPTVFLQRRAFADYDEKLTFDLADVLATPIAPPPVAPVAPAPAPAAAAPAGSGRSARELLALVKGARWVELLEASRSVETAGHIGAARVSPAFAAMSLSDGADFVALRGAGGCLLGTRLGASERQMWSMLAADATFGAAVAGLFAAGALSRRPRREVSRELGWTRGDPGAEAPLREAFAFGRDVLAVALLSGGELACGMGRGIEEDECLAIAGRRAPLFSANPFVDPLLAADGAFAGRSLVTGEDRTWSFGVELPGAAPQRTLWVFTRRHGSQGVGWACLAALARALQGSPGTSG